MTDREIAETIDQQIGNRAFFMMGVKNKFVSGPGLQFDIRGSEWKRIVITLSPDDTYRVTFYKGRHMTTKQEHEGIYVDQLHKLIESTTGLYLSL